MAPNSDHVYTDPADPFVLEIFGSHHRTTGPGAGQRRGWYWYCDDHDSGGSADSEAEARAMIAAHAKWWRSPQRGNETMRCEGLYAFDVEAVRREYQQRGMHDRLD